MAETFTASTAPASLADPPRPAQRVLHDGKEYTTVKEGMAHILIPPNTATSVDPKKHAKSRDDDEQKQSVFYNPIQQFNRDLSVLAIRAYGEDAIAAKTRKYHQEKLREKRKSERKRKARSENEGAAEGNDNKRAKVDDGAETAAAEDAKDDSTAVPDQPTGEAHHTNGSSKGPKFRILDALSATGLRALRYAHEIPFATSVTGNDLSPSAVEAMKLNIKHNRLEHKITPVIGNAVAHMYQFVGQEGIGGPGQKYDVIDLDPYGTAVPFLDGAIQAVNDGGLLCVTCTDAGVFASTGYLEKTYSQYGGLPIKGHHSHEGGLRLILHAIATAAAKYGISIEPLLSLSIDFYARVFVRVRKSPAEVKFLAGKQMLVYNCDSGCGAWTTQFLARNHVQEGKKGTPFFKYSFAQGPSAPPHCPHCGFKTHLSGPMWGGPLHNPAFIEKILSYLPTVDKDTYQTTTRIEGMLRTAHEELLFETSSPYAHTSNSSEPSTPGPDEIPKMDPLIVDHHPFFFNVSQLSRIMHCQALPDAAFKGALRNLGYRTTRSHCKPGTVKTDAPWEVIWEVMREWVRQRSPVMEEKFKINTPGRGVWEKKRTVEDVEMVDEAKDGEKKSEKEGESGEKESGSAGVEPQLNDEKKKRQWASGDGLDKLHKLEIVFDEKLGKDKEDKKLVRYPMNPRANWGPMNRAK
ncbi:Dimethylguanosine tRNA methyltransferase [Lasiodiplodia theobromae]|uniref:tRNA (guanine(26)-N(2))-dimethyltransferase n=1 Tax=Lasiodiplodia theobromae TaxID=45133 RepID=A0A5N5DGF7_9PEZI|nr:Dimethylguanosine tRNA methyltransferase [Lasiodiplodia theobromae]KAB2576590.1 tRNA (guanine(26)-N(2))-dimethyltransferase [Lasiodiplodia theobromae]KAF4546609.1 Dimethylguanosine tRNA methyltransferase [Lasiodiplodia theobromae]